CYLIRHPSRESPFPVRPFSLDQQRPLFDRALLTAIRGREYHPFDSALERDVSEDHSFDRLEALDDVEAFNGAAHRGGRGGGAPERGSAPAPSSLILCAQALAGL